MLQFFETPCRVILDKDSSTAVLTGECIIDVHPVQSVQQSKKEKTQAKFVSSMLLILLLTAIVRHSMPAEGDLC